MAAEPIRVLHLVARLEDGGGQQTWLLQLLRHLDLERFQIDVLARSGLESAGATAMRELGCTVSQIPNTRRQPLAFLRELRRALRASRYDVVHSSINHYSALVVREAHALGIPVRISHSRGARRGAHNPPARRLLIAALRPWLLKHSTDLLAISRDAAAALYGEANLEDPRVLISPSGIDLEPFGRSYDRAEARAELGIPEDAFVVGNVSRLVAGKNHKLLLEVAAELRRHSDATWVLMVGAEREGQMRTEIEKHITELGLTDRTVLTGHRRDVARLMSAAMDVFVFPSEHEGLGRVLIEAQASGLPCVMSDCMPSEVDVVTDIAFRIGLDRSPREWADLALEAARAREAVDAGSCYEIVARSPLNIVNVAKQLTTLYERAVVADSGSPIT